MAVGDKHKRRVITKQNIKITNAGDGLSKALEVDPHDFDYGDIVYVLSMCVATGDGFEPVGEKELAEQWKLKTRSATILDAAVAAEYIDAQQARIDAAEQAKRDIEQMALDPLNVDGRDEVSAKRRTKEEEVDEDAEDTDD